MSLKNTEIEPKMTHDRLQQEIYNYIYNQYPQTRGNCWHTPNEFIPDTFIQKQCGLFLKGKIPNWLAGIFKLYIEKHFVHQLSKRKQIGVLAGVTDLVLYWNGVLLMMDIKVTGDTLSDAQLRFIQANEKQCGKFIEINTLQQGKADIDTFFQIKY
jgi:hypothetical protein